MTLDPRDESQRWPAWRWYALAAAALIGLAVLELTGVSGGLRP